MTAERQDITEDFYAGDNKDITVAVIDENGAPKNLTDAVVTYSMFDDDGTIRVYKNSEDGVDMIEITDAPNGVCVIKLVPSDTMDITGTFRHHVYVRDSSFDHATVSSGKVVVFQSFNRIFRGDSIQAYLIGG